MCKTMLMCRVVLMCGVAVCLTVFVGCGKIGGPGPPPTPEEKTQQIEDMFDFSAVSDILTVREIQVLEDGFIDVYCTILKPAQIVVEYPTAEGTQTTEMNVHPPETMIFIAMFDSDAGGKIVIKPKE